MFGARGLLAMFVTGSQALLAQVPLSTSVEWEMSYPGDGRGWSTAITGDREHGYFLSGTIVSESGHGFVGGDILLVRMDSQGKPLWQGSFGATGRDVAYSVESSGDGGCVVAGSVDDQSDAYLIKVDADGEGLWERTYGGDGDERAYSVKRTSDGGYVLAGRTSSFSETHYNAYLVKVDLEGQLVWERSFGGDEKDYATFAAETRDGGFILTGQQRSFNPVGSYDVYLVRTDGSGNRLWQASFGGEASDQGWFVRETKDGGFIVVAYTKSFGAEPRFVYVIRTDEQGSGIWERTFGANGAYNAGLSVVEKDDGGFLVGATTSSLADNSVRFPYLIRTDASGDLLWERLFNGQKLGKRYGTASPTADGGFIFGGETPSAANFADLYALKLLPVDLSNEPRFLRGDCNDDGAIDISDAVFSLGSLFLGQGEGACADACDSNDDGEVDISDAISTLGVLFLGNGTIPLPGVEKCGVDPTQDDVGCDAYRGCP